MPPPRAIALAAALLLVSCSHPPDAVPGGGVTTATAPARPVAPTKPPQGDIDLGEQRAFAGNVGRVNIMLLAGEAYAERVRRTIPAFAAVLRITNGESQILAMDREKDEIVLRLVDGREVARTDIWQREDWLLPLAALPATDRARFRYPDGVIPGAAVEVAITFDAPLALADVKDVWVRLPALPGGGTVLGPLDLSAAPPRP